MAIIDKVSVKGTEYDIVDNSAVHTVNNTVPDENGNVSVTKEGIGAKGVQTAVSDPTAAGTATSFIKTISQNAQGVITPTKASLPTASTTVTGIVQLNNTLTSTSITQALTAAQGKVLNDAISNTQDGLAIIADGNTHSAIASGQFVYVKNHSSLADGLYKAAAAIATNGTLSTSNLTADASGGLNAIKADLDTLNSNIESHLNIRYLIATDTSSLKNGIISCCEILITTVSEDGLYMVNIVIPGVKTLDGWLLKRGNEATGFVSSDGVGYIVAYKPNFGIEIVQQIASEDL